MKILWRYFCFFVLFCFHFPFFPTNCLTHHVSSLLPTLPALALIRASSWISFMFQALVGQCHFSQSGPSLPKSTVPAKRGPTFYLGQSWRTDNLTQQWQKISIMKSSHCFTDLIIFGVKPWPQSTLCSSFNTPWKAFPRWRCLISWH